MTRRYDDQRRGWHRLIFTADGDLDFGWIILVACCIVGLASFVASGLGVFTAPPWAWAWFGSFTAMAFIAGAAISRARLIANSTMPADVANAIAHAPPFPGMDADESGPHP